MNLVIDIGNTMVKIGVFDHDQIVATKKFKLDAFLESISRLLVEFSQIQNGIVSSVGSLPKTLLEPLRDKLDLKELDSTTPLPFNNKYKSKNTLGVDRIALVAAASKLFSHTNCLIIDAGTCITYDFMDNENSYLGGAISPGLRMRYQSLNNYTAKLPLLETKNPEGLIGSNTIESIHSGVVFGTVMEIDGAIDGYKNKFADLTVILTGGDGKFLSNQLKNSIFANSNFLLEGLNHILEYNSH